MTTASQTSHAETLHAGSVEPWAIRHTASHARLWVVAVLGLTADLWTKHWAFGELKPGDTEVVIPNLCSLQRSLNPGALFGLGAGYTPIFVGASVLALLFVLYLFANTSASRRSMHVALGLVLAGAFGNLYDRISQNAYVAYYPNNTRLIGTLVNETDRTITLGDFPDGANPRVRVRPQEEASGRQPVVRDFIRIEARIGGLALWPWVFNIADALLVFGVAVLLLNFWQDRKAPSPDTSAER